MVVSAAAAAEKSGWCMGGSEAAVGQIHITLAGWVLCGPYFRDPRVIHRKTANQDKLLDKTLSPIIRFCVPKVSL